MHPSKDVLFRKLSSYFWESGVILCLHRILPNERRSPLDIPRDLEVTPQYLEAVLFNCLRLGYEFISMDEIAQRLGERQQRPQLAITFDDGYRDNLEHALPVLERMEAPFTVYVTTGLVEGAIRGWWHELEDLILQSDALLLPDSTGELSRHPCGNRDSRNQTYLKAYSLLKNAGPRAVEQLRQIRDLNGIEAVVGRDERMMDWGELRRLDAHPLVEIGAHTRTHPRLIWLDEAGVRNEISGSRRDLEERLGHPVRHLAYPHGARSDLPDNIARIASEEGFATAVTTEGRNLRPTDAGHPHTLPRKAISGLQPPLSSTIGHIVGWKDSLVARRAGQAGRWLRQVFRSDSAPPPPPWG